jgi:uncharacterized protein
MNRLHPGAKWQFRIGFYILMIFVSIFLTWFIFPIFFFTFLAISGSGVFFTAGLLTFFLYIIIVILLGELYARLSYNNWFYEFTDDGLRVERGIIWKRYSNVPYERIQNIDIQRGVVARILGFSSLMIQTAGYSATPHAEGYIPALEMGQAEKIREFVMNKITKRKK